MAKYVPDSKTQRWIVIAPIRSDRPDEIHPETKKSVCAFCYGSEQVTPPEVFRIGPGEPNKSGWHVRVVPNKYPITDIHEVIIHSPDCDHDFEELPLKHVILILQAYRERYNAHRQEGRVLIFCNHGVAAGASLSHPHSQLVVVPRQISLDILSREPITNVIEEEGEFVVYCPEFSQWPYEVWIAPKIPDGVFGTISDSGIATLAQLLQKTLIRLTKKAQEPALKKIHPNEPFSYNFYISHDTNWYLRIIPRLIHRAGFELGTGLNVNIVDPVSASEELKRV